MDRYAQPHRHRQHPPPVPATQSHHASSASVPPNSPPSLPSIHQLHPFLPPASHGPQHHPPPQHPYRDRPPAQHYPQHSEQPYHGVAQLPSEDNEPYAPESDDDGLDAEHEIEANEAGDSVPQKKKRRRQALSCSECKRRKIRCDRQQPCTPCARRGGADKCKWNIVEPLEKFVTRPEYDELKRNISRLEATVSKLSETVQNVVADRPSNPPAPAVASYHQPPIDSAGPERRIPQQLSKAFDSLEGFSTFPFSHSPSNEAAAIANILGTCMPRREVCDRLIEFYFEKVAWCHNVLHAKSFHFSYVSFWSFSEDVRPSQTSPSFIALTFVVLCLALTSMDPQEAHVLGISADTADWKRLSKLLWSGSKQALALADFLNSTNIEVIQTIILYCYCNFDQEQGWNIPAPLVAVAISIAHKMGLSRLGRETSGQVPLPGLIKRELSRRAWWHLVALDWDLSTNQRFTYLIQPNQMDTALPANLDYDEMDESKPFVEHPKHVWTTCSFLIAKAELSACVRELTDRHNSSEGLTYEFILEHENAIKENMHLGPKCFISPDIDLERINPRARWERSMLISKLNNRVIRLHRRYMLMGYHDAKFQRSTDVCVRAAEQILDAYEESKASGFPGCQWCIVYMHTYTAAVVLLVDQIYATAKGDVSPPDLESLAGRKRKIYKASQSLKNASDVSGLAHKTSTVLEQLLAELMPRKAVIAGTKRGASPTSGASKRQRTSEPIDPRDVQHPPTVTGAEPGTAVGSLPSPATFNKASGTSSDYIDAWLAASSSASKRIMTEPRSRSVQPLILPQPADEARFWNAVFDMDLAGAQRVQLESQAMALSPLPLTHASLTDSDGPPPLPPALQWVPAVPDSRGLQTDISGVTSTWQAGDSISSAPPQTTWR